MVVVIFVAVIVFVVIAIMVVSIMMVAIMVPVMVPVVGMMMVFIPSAMKAVVVVVAVPVPVRMVAAPGGFAFLFPSSFPHTMTGPIVVPIMISIPVVVAIVIPVPVGITILTILIIVDPASVAGRRYIPVRGIRRNAVVAVDILHALFHADNFAGVVGGPICLPARVVAVKALLVA